MIILRLEMYKWKIIIGNKRELKLIIIVVDNSNVTLIFVFDRIVSMAITNV